MRTSLTLDEARWFARHDPKRWRELCLWIDAENLGWVVAVELVDEGLVLVESVVKPAMVDPLRRSAHSIAVTRREVVRVRTPPPFVRWPESA